MSEQMQFCRFCSDINPPIYLFQSNLIPEIIFILSNIEVLKGDQFPQHICLLCYQKLLDFNDFRKVLILSNTNFEQKFSSSEDVHIKVEKPDENFDDDDEKFLSEFIEVKIEPSLEEAINNDEFDNEDTLNDESCGEAPKKKSRRERKQNPEALFAIICDICGQRSFTQRRHEGHLRTHQGLNPAVCHECNVDFPRWDQLAYHTQLLHGKDEYACQHPGCGRKFTVKRSYKQHVAVHDKTGSCVCDECGSVLSSKSNLRSHIRRVHVEQRPRPKTFACDKCPKMFGALKNLRRHLLIHDPNKKFECDVCGLKKSTLSDLKIHMNYHSRERLFKCSCCDKEYPTKWRMKHHMDVVHLGIKRYVCDICGQAFGHGKTLKHHRMTHTGDRPHKCNICGTAFIQLKSLKAHVTISHTTSEGRPHKCDICGAGFVTVKTLKGHITNRHKK